MVTGAKDYRPAKHIYVGPTDEERNQQTRAPVGSVIKMGRTVHKGKFSGTLYCTGTHALFNWATGRRRYGYVCL